MLGLIQFVARIPTLFFTPLAGVLADRYSRHRIVLFTQCFAMVQALPLSALALSGRAEVGFVASLAVHGYGLLWVICDAPALRLRPILVSKDGLQIRIGLRWNCFVSPDQLEGADQVTEADENEQPRAIMEAAEERRAEP